MKIAVIGTGNVGSALGHSLAKAGNQVYFGVRNPESTKTLKALELVREAVITTISVACTEAEVIIIATPPEAILELVEYLKPNNQKVIIDTTNSIKTRPEPYNTAFHAIKMLAAAENVVKCFNSTGFENLLNPIYDGIGIDMFVAGNSQSAKKTAQALALQIGFGTCYDFGGDDKVELLEKFALSWINLAIMQGLGRNLAFKLLNR